MKSLFRESLPAVWRALVFLLAALGVAGCVALGKHDRPVQWECADPPEPYPAVAQANAADLAITLGKLGEVPDGPKPPLNILVQTGGGEFAPFAAGAMLGWTASGTRPTFDVVTGLSSGALIGAFAFLGPKYDRNIEAIFKNLRTSTLYRMRPIRYLLFQGAVASADPLEQIINREVNETFLADLRQAHVEGRRLFVATTNLETKRLVVWDIGAIASSGRPDAGKLVRKVLLATVTWPGLMPPVEFDVVVNGRCFRELHVDGGGTTQGFVHLSPTGHSTLPGWLAGSNLYVVDAGKLYADPVVDTKRSFARIYMTLSTLNYALARACMFRLYTLCMASGMQFNLIHLPQDYRGAPRNFLNTKPEEMQRLFEKGFEMALHGCHWRHTPPDAEPGEEERPRGATGPREPH